MLYYDVQTIQRSLEELEVKQRRLEERGVQLENLLRSVDGKLLAIFDFVIFVSRHVDSHRSISTQHGVAA